MQIWQKSLIDRKTDRSENYGKIVPKITITARKNQLISIIAFAVLTTNKFCSFFNNIHIHHITFYMLNVCFLLSNYIFEFK